MTSLADSAPLRVALYARVSTEDQADRGTIQAQLTLLRNLAQAYGWHVVGEYVDDGISGTIPLGDRPDGRRLLEDARSGVFASVVAYRLDRVGRSLRALLDAHDALETAGVTVRSATEPFDTSTAIGKFLFQLLASLAELEKSTITERMTMGRDRVARDGKWTGGPVPFGYDLDGDGCPTPSTRLLAGLGLTEAAVARDVLERLADGSTLLAECRRLEALGVPSITRYSGRPDVLGARWWPSKLHKMVQNPIYKGTFTLASRNGAIERPVPALVSPETWERAQAQLTRNRDLSRRPEHRPYLLRGLITCGNCGRAYVGAPKKERDGRTTFYYRCAGQLQGHLAPDRPKCHGRAVRAVDVERDVWDDCRGFIHNPGDALAEARRQLRERLSQSAGLDDERARIGRLLADKEAERERVMTLFRRGRASLADTEAQLDAVNAEASELRAQLDALRAQRDLADAFEAHYVQAAAMLAQLRDRLEEIEERDDWSKKRQVVEFLVTGVRVGTEIAGGKKQATVTMTYTFAPSRVVDSSAPAR